MKQISPLIKILSADAFGLFFSFIVKSIAIEKFQIIGYWKQSV